MARGPHAARQSILYSCRHVHVRKIFEVLFGVFESQPVNSFYSSRTLSKTVNSYICLIVN